jgi:sugar O-acyltransferase (sialic acid O-acetyltransferase NeuD family)
MLKEDMSEDILIFGAGGFGMEVAWLIEDLNKVEDRWRILGYLDDDQSKWGRTFYGYTVVQGKRYLNDLSEKTAIAVAIGDPDVRCGIVRELKKFAVEFPTLIHPSVIMAARSEIGEGSIIAAGSILTVEVKIGKHVHINPNCIISHGVVIEDYCTLFPGVNVSGDTRIEQLAAIGVGTKVIQGIHIGRQAVIGAGAVVVRDVPARVVSAGNPSKVIKTRQ